MNDMIVVRLLSFYLVASWLGSFGSPNITVSSLLLHAAGTRLFQLIMHIVVLLFTSQYESSALTALREPPLHPKVT
ncbi:hypothetical protein CPAR01_06212 [Colletotrichum paranaense]|uniref:Uncharacterized protein n=2 Tax=Colletotrichum acutatum species complex TaxID=2707335 RepID=A0AAI9XTP9_9PEZI|nr:uncharacterized protein CPAR01_06212 [Colletotrichum paranaense]KAK1459278.1 hypothetical protein CMEL01_02277 [Colletotrichum melonis]KAK1542825.1 hypothetical protein CPAR01_06212 [Colletotrichum paranaense]